jgi:large subunit ribosomal protein L10
LTNQAKIDVIEGLRKEFQKARVAILVDFRGLNVQKMMELRNQFREAAVDYKVIKNTLARRAVQGTKFEKLIEFLTGPTSIALSRQDEIAPAKVLSAFIKKEKTLQIKGGVLGGKLLGVSDVEELADTPSKEVVLGRFMSGLQSPLVQLAGVFQGVLRDFMGTLKAIEEKRQA